MPKIKISISIDERLAAKIDAVKRLEERGSFSNALLSVIDTSKFEFIETTGRLSEAISYIAIYGKETL